MENDNFKELFFKGVPMLDAYKLVHMDDLMSGAMQFASQKSMQKVTNSVISNKNRPIENGLSANKAVTVKPKISEFTPEQIQDYIDRAASGQKIDFVNNF